MNHAYSIRKCMNNKNSQSERFLLHFGCNYLINSVVYILEGNASFGIFFLFSFPRLFPEAVGITIKHCLHFLVRKAFELEAPADGRCKSRGHGG